MSIPAHAHASSSPPRTAAVAVVLKRARGTRVRACARHPLCCFLFTFNVFDEKQEKQRCSFFMNDVNEVGSSTKAAILFRCTCRRWPWHLAQPTVPELPRTRSSAPQVRLLLSK